MEGVVFQVQRFSVHDGPGIRTTVFLKGCPLRCWWCHNPEGLASEPAVQVSVARCIRCGACAEVCPTGAAAGAGADPALCTRCGACLDACPAGVRELVGRRVGVGDLLAELERDRPFFEESGGGITFSGGEPLLQAPFLLACLQECRERGLHTAVDTCGHAPWEELAAVARLADLVLYDLKVMDGEGHRRATGADNGRILENLRRLAAAGRPLWIRVPLVPGVTDGEENAAALGVFVAGLPGRPPVRLLPFHGLGAGKRRRLGLPPGPPVAPIPAERIEEIAARLGALGLEVRIGG